MEYLSKAKNLNEAVREMCSGCELSTHCKFGCGFLYEFIAKECESDVLES